MGMGMSVRGGVNTAEGASDLMTFMHSCTCLCACALESTA